MEDPATYEELLESAVRSPEPIYALRSVAKRMLNEGIDREDILGTFTVFVLKLRQQDREAEENLVLDVMDQLVGWCHPDHRL
jgi:hypothetical protein